MEKSIKNLPDSKIEIQVELSPLELEEYYKKALFELSKNLEINGFRVGRIPSDIAEKKIGKETILTEAANLAIQENYRDIIKKENLEIIEKAEVEIVKLALKNPFVFKIKTSILPEIKLPNYKELAVFVKEKKVSVEEKEIEDTLKWIQGSRAKFTALDKEAKKEDFVEIEYSSLQIDNGEKKKDAFILGKGSFIGGFEEKLEGMKASEEKDFSLTIPKDYFNKELAGKEVIFKVKMTSVLKMELPEINDEFIKTLGDFKDVGSLKQSIKEGLEIEKKLKEKERLREEILEKISKEIKWELPEILIQKEKERLFNEFKNNFSEKAQISFNDYLTKVKKTEKEIEDSFFESAQRNVKIFLILREIAKQEEICASDDEVKEEINEILKKYKDIKSLEKDLDSEKLEYYTKERITNEKVLQFLEKISKEKTN